MKKLYFILLILCFKANAQVPVELAKLKNFDLCYPDKFINYNVKKEKLKWQQKQNHMLEQQK